MNHNQFIKNLREELAKELPGLQSQLKLAPAGRNGMPEKQVLSKAKKSAVLILLNLNETDIYIPFIKRIRDGSMHSGQIAFPGGKFEKFDGNLKETALREAQEEIGIDAQSIVVLAELTPLYIPVSNFLVQPIVAFTEKSQNYVIAEDEVEELYTIPLNELINADIVEKTFSVRGYTLTAPFFVLKEIEIWGATAMILNEFIDIIKKTKRT
jgi:8-oxo-dGTP pyrophosphatase MutT (NUDIX family)